MRSSPLILVTALGLLLAVLAAATLSYRSAQDLLLSEANSLYSSDARAATGDIKAVLAEAQSSGLNVQIFLPLSEDGRTRAVVSATDALDRIPSHNVRWDVSDERPGALVGANRYPETGRIEVGESTYSVAGVLGARDRSLVADDVLIYDPALFTDSTLRSMIVDGPDASTVVKALKDVRPVGVGFTRRTNVDYVSPVIISLSAILLLLGAGLAGYLVCAVASRKDKIEHLWGRSRVEILYRRTAVNGAVWALSAVVVSLMLALIGVPSRLLVEYAQVSTVLMGVFVMAFVTTFIGRKAVLR